MKVSKQLYEISTYFSVCWVFFIDNQQNTETLLPDNDDDVQAKEVEEWEDDDDDDASLKEMLEVGDEDDMNMTRLKTMFGTMRGES